MKRRLFIILVVLGFVTLIATYRFAYPQPMEHPSPAEMAEKY